MRDFSPSADTMPAAISTTGTVKPIEDVMSATSPSGCDTIRPITVNFPQADIDELRRRVAATRWPERETVTDKTQGVQLATLQKLARYWGERL